jgi:hypothetical protein
MSTTWSSNRLFIHVDGKTDRRTLHFNASTHVKSVEPLRNHKNASHPKLFFCVWMHTWCSRRILYESSMVAQKISLRGITNKILPCKLRFMRFYLVRITPRRRYHKKTLVFSGIFIFQIFLLLSNDTWVLYIESTKTLPLSCRFYKNSSVSYVVAKHSKMLTNDQRDLFWTIHLVVKFATP